MDISMDRVRALREKTGAGILDCKKALAESNGDVEAAVEYLRKKGIAKAEKLASRKAAEGLVHAYIHPGGRIGSLVEVNCETDFVARTDEFKALVNDIAMQVAATAPLALSPDGLDKDLVEKEKEIYRSQAMAEGKPEKIVEKIVESKLSSFYSEVCLLEQGFIKNPEIKIGDLVKQYSGKFGENIVIRRFARFQLGDLS